MPVSNFKITHTCMHTHWKQTITPQPWNFHSLYHSQRARDEMITVRTSTRSSYWSTDWWFLAGGSWLSRDGPCKPLNTKDVKAFCFLFFIFLNKSCLQTRTHGLAIIKSNEDIHESQQKVKDLTTANVQRLSQQEKWSSKRVLQLHPSIITYITQAGFSDPRGSPPTQGILC